MHDAFLILSTLLLLLLFVQSSSIQVSSQKKTLGCSSHRFTIVIQLGVKLERDPSGLPGTSFAQTSQHSNNHIANTSNSDTNMIISSIDTEELGDGTCDPPCLNGGLCSEGKLLNLRASSEFTQLCAIVQIILPVQDARIVNSDSFRCNLTFVLELYRT